MAPPCQAFALNTKLLVKTTGRLGLAISGQSLGHRGRGDADGLLVDAVAHRVGQIATAVLS